MAIACPRLHAVPAALSLEGGLQWWALAITDGKQHCLVRALRRVSVPSAAWEQGSLLLNPLQQSLPVHALERSPLHPFPSCATQRRALSFVRESSESRRRPLPRRCEAVGGNPVALTGGPACRLPRQLPWSQGLPRAGLLRAMQKMFWLRGPLQAQTQDAVADEETPGPWCSRWQPTI